MGVSPSRSNELIANRPGARQPLHVPFHLHPTAEAVFAGDDKLGLGQVEGSLPNGFVGERGQGAIAVSNAPGGLG